MIEMLFRGLTLIREEENVSDIPLEWFGDYAPTTEALAINRTRIATRTMEYERVNMKGYFKA